MIIKLKTIYGYSMCQSPVAGRVGAEKRPVCCMIGSRNVAPDEAAEENRSAKETENPGEAGGNQVIV